jgi:Tfp pilus assembly protein PilO
MLLFPVVLLLVLYFVIAQVVPSAKAISATKDSIKQQEITLAKAKERLNKVTSFQQEIESHSQEMDYVMNFVPNDQREEILLSDISQMAQESGVNLFSVGFSEGRSDVRSGAATDEKSHLIEGKMIISGSYDNLKKFTHKLFRIKRLYTFKTFDLTKAEQKKKDEEDATPQELVLSGVISFAYGYIPGVGAISPATIGTPINFDLIDTVMNATTNTQPLVTQKKNRPNPFLP